MSIHLWPTSTSPLPFFWQPPGERIRQTVARGRGGRLLGSMDVAKQRWAGLTGLGRSRSRQGLEGPPSSLPSVLVVDTPRLPLSPAIFLPALASPAGLLSLGILPVHTLRDSVILWGSLEQRTLGLCARVSVLLYRWWGWGSLLGFHSNFCVIPLLSKI